MSLAAQAECFGTHRASRLITTEIQSMPASASTVTTAQARVSDQATKPGSCSAGAAVAAAGRVTRCEETGHLLQ